MHVVMIFDLGTGAVLHSSVSMGTRLKPLLKKNQIGPLKKPVTVTAPEYVVFRE